ncbi:hypothetical protein ACQKP7_21430 [Pseudomonas frederiksbergensis]|uniref:hypothetical protein n=1 Tax=Pseudomonas frederiksbergensis TaxID=104087 RepID=UPI003D063DD8
MIDFETGSQILAAFFVVEEVDMSGKYAVLVVGVGIVLIPAVNESTRYKDLIESLLLAQLVANKKIEKVADGDWYNSYVEFLDSYWLRHSKSRMDLPVAQDSVESVGDWLSTAMSNAAADKSGNAAATLQRLTGLSGTEPALSLLRSHMQKVSPNEPLAPAKAVRLLVVVAHTPISITSVYMEFETDKVLGANPLAQPLQAADTRGSVCMRCSGANLSETLYGPVRNAIALKVRDRIEDNVATLILPDEVSINEICSAD